jgi:hypothetical protein
MWHFQHGTLKELTQKLMDFIHLGDFKTRNNKKTKRLQGLKTLF